MLLMIAKFTRRLMSSLCLPWALRNARGNKWWNSLPYYWSTSPRSTGLPETNVSGSACASIRMNVLVFTALMLNLLSTNHSGSSEIGMSASADDPAALSFLASARSRFRFRRTPLP